MKRPVIGIVPLVDIQRESYWMLPGYMDGVAESGGLPLMLPLTEDEVQVGQLAAFCDGFLFTGGQDVGPSLYGEEKDTACGECCPERDAMEMKLLDAALRYDKPVFGICRGIQFINAALGGMLYQDLPSQHPSGIEHHQHPPYDAGPRRDADPVHAPCGAVGRWPIRGQQLSSSGGQDACAGVVRHGHRARWDHRSGVYAGQAFRVGRPVAPGALLPGR